MPSGGPYEMEIILNGETTTLHDIYIGRVYLMSGQSNMQMKVKCSVIPANDLTPNPLVRGFYPELLEQPNDYFKPTDGWISANESNILNRMHLGYLLGREIQSDTGEAVGVIGCYQGASGILSWLPEQFDASISPELLHIDYHQEPFSTWNGRGTLYHAMFERLCPLSLTAVVWYQGESDTTEAEAALYEQWLCELVSLWRRDLLDENLFFAIVQIADFDPRRDEGWRKLQQAQAQAAERIAHADLVISRDVCESCDIHPRDKRLLAGRIAALLKTSV